MANTVNFDLELSIKQFQTNLSKVESDFKKTANSVVKQSTTMSNAFSVFTGVLSAGAITAFASSVINMGSSIVSAAADMQLLEQQLTILTGSMETAKTLMQDINELSTTTPFTPKDLVSATKTLIGFGVETNKVVGYLEDLSDIAAVSGGDIDELSRVIGKVEGQGRLTAETFESLVNQGINLSTVLADELGIATEDLRTAMSNGAITADVLRRAIQTATEAGGQYADGAAKSAKLINGAWSTLVGNGLLLAATIGKDLVQALTDVIKRTNDWYKANKQIIAQNLQEVIKPIVDAIKEFNPEQLFNRLLDFANAANILASNLNKIALAGKLIVGAKLGTFIAATTVNLLRLIPAIKGVAVAGGLLSTSLGGILPIAAALVVAFIDMDDILSVLGGKTQLQKVETSMINIQEEMKGLQRDLEYIQRLGQIKPLNDEQIQRTEELKTKLKELQQEYYKAVAERNRLESGGAGFGPEAPATTTKKSTTSGPSTSAQKSKYDELEQLALEHQRNLALIDMEAYNSQLEVDNTRHENSIARELELRQGEIERLRDFELAKIAVTQESELERAETLKTASEKQIAIEKANNKAELAREAAQNKAIISLEKAKVDAKQKEQERDIKLQDGYITAASGFLNAGLAIAKEGSKERKALAITDATINTYAGASRALADFPYPASIAVAASVVASGLAQVAKITSTGNYANGGIIPGSSFAGDNLTANVNSGEMILNRRQQTQLFNLANGNAGSNTALIERLDSLEMAIMNQPVILVADDTEIARSASRGVQNGVEIGRSR